MCLSSGSCPSSSIVNELFASVIFFFYRIFSPLRPDTSTPSIFTPLGNVVALLYLVASKCTQHIKINAIIAMIIQLACQYQLYQQRFCTHIFVSQAPIPYLIIYLIAFL